MIHYGDITKIKGAEVPLVDVVTGGSPCQDLSIAGKRKGSAGSKETVNPKRGLPLQNKVGIQQADNI